MKRYVYANLTDWLKSKRRKPLLLRGARQVGKTWLVEKLANENFEYFLKIDFEEKQELITLFDGDLNPKKLYSCRCILEANLHILELTTLRNFVTVN